ncbi:hypothetical protein F0M18_09110 [Pseudohalioglobus sediminis]|uniref:MAPEG family protein n=1 Tax=Pseudohalioglobus sediminis TaxID=2606449 RepID=A0A5B0X0F5_9GAMM|nr:MAPEG family protein [Pseudohalioglobus sediminis]KAA1192802.1 hypothetical protein F0M18_09110 [Pseudohalioglobus sediminis]
MELFNAELALPIASMLCLTLLVWVYMFVRRLGYLTANQIDAEQLKTPAEVQAILPPDVSGPGNNFKNLLEMPVLFYVVCLYLTVFGMVDSLHITCAWVFVAGRVLHSLIHCTYNRVMHRFLVYLVSSLAVWVMVVRALLAAL